MDRPKVLFVLSRSGAAPEFVSLLETQRFEVVARPDIKVYELVLVLRPDLVFLYHGPSLLRNWQEIAADVRRADQEIPIALVTANGSEELAVAALRLGLADYLALPISAEALLEAVERALRRRPVADGGTLRGSSCGVASSRTAADRIVGANPSLRQMKTYMTRAAAADCTVLITGETGTGKELAAEFIHDSSPRKKKPFVCVNCAAIPDTLLESELFGHTQGAFTGAQNPHDGLLAAANGGTVFLDEIGDMSSLAQAKILRVLERKEICRLGGTAHRQLDVRFVAATNQDLEALANRGGFRKDLFFRLNVAHVELPPLRQRKDDIPLLVDHYRRYFSSRTDSAPPEFSEESLRCLLRYDWPGNIRELKNVLENIFLDPSADKILPEHLPAHLRNLVEKSSGASASERELLVEALCSAHWNKSKAAEKLRWSRMTLYRKMAKYQISSLAS